MAGVLPKLSDWCMLAVKSRNFGLGSAAPCAEGSDSAKGTFKAYPVNTP